MSSSVNKTSLEDAAQAEARRLANDPNVVCVGYGLKMVGGRPQMAAAIQYHVRAKVASDDQIRQLGSAPVPAQIEGYQTDVLPWTIARPTACPSRHRPTGERGDRVEDPLVGGTSTSILGGFMSFPTGYGTLGGICFDTSSSAAMALSNAHVYGLDIGHDAIQPFTPVLDYVGGTVAWLACGGPLSHLFFWTAPSPLTGILTTAAAAAWVAAAASDAEDPTRWGQRVGPLPPADAKTYREKVHLEAEIPRIPFPGRDWTTRTRWDYTRQTDAGETSASLEQERGNEHVLTGKRVFTDQGRYAGGQTVRICAEIWTSYGNNDHERFVVAHCFPIDEPERVVQRVLGPSDICARIDHANGNDFRQCLFGFRHPVPGLDQINFPIIEPPFVFIGEDSTVLLDPGPGNPSGVTALQLPARPLAFACPPSTHVELKLFHGGGSVHVKGISANGRTVAEAEAGGEPDVLHSVALDGPEIVRVVLEASETKAWLAEVCADKRRLDMGPWESRSTWYTGTLTLASNEPDGRWAVVVVTQTLDPTPTGGDPVEAARRLGGIVDSANVREVGECACEILYDHTFVVDSHPVVIE
jgi:hypothetical protein